MRDKNTQALVPLHKTTMGELLNSKKPKDCSPIEKAQGMGYQMNRINNMEVLLKSMYKYFQIKSINLNTSFSISLKDTNETVGISLNNLNFVPFQLQLMVCWPLRLLLNYSELFELRKQLKRKV